MRRDLPPLNALRAFEAAARRLSFTRAAAELNVTQAAVSHQIRALEEHLGQPLFRRLTRGLALTDAGQRLLPAARSAFDTIAEATAEIRPADGDGRRLTISVLTSFAAKWLVPRLSAFRKLHPEIDTWLLASDSCIDFTEGDGEIGIRYGPGTYTGLCADMLMPGDVIAVCSPALLEGPHPLTGTEALRHHTLIHDEIPVEFDLVDWPKWLKAAGIQGIDGRIGPRYSHLNMALDAALQGDGVVLVKRVLVEDELASGRLVAPFDITTHESFAYYLVYPEDHLRMPKVAAFRDWVLGITARHRIEEGCEPRISA